MGVREEKKILSSIISTMVVENDEIVTFICLNRYALARLSPCGNIVNFKCANRTILSKLSIMGFLKRNLSAFKF